MSGLTKVLGCGAGYLPRWTRAMFAGVVLATASLGSVDVRAQSPAPPSAEAASLRALPVAKAIRIVKSGEITRFAVDLSEPLDVRAFPMTNPDRIIVDLPETSFAVDPAQGRPSPDRKGRKRSDKEDASAPLVASYRFGLLGPGRSRIVIDLGAPARVVDAVSTTGPDGGAILQIDLARTDRLSFTSAAFDAAKGVAAPLAAPASATTGDDDSKIVVVIDPGHGGIDVGAQAPGRILEKDIVFEFATALVRRLEESGRYRPVLTRTGDVFVPLSERVRIARAANAQLFLSIHADTLNEGGVSGATVYTVSDKASDAHAARLAEKENLADKAAGFDGVEDAGEVSDILFDLTRRETRAYSHVFARTLVSVWREAARLNKNPLRSAGFKVLKAPDVPSALLELGYLSSQKDSALLMDAEWRARTAAAVARSIDQFFAMRSPAMAEVDDSGVGSVQR